MNVAGAIAEKCHSLGVEVVFTVSGNQNLPLLEAFNKIGIRIIHARHENGAVYMADAWGQLRGEPGVCILTAGPGHTSGLTALAAAAAAESPVVCLSASSNFGERGAFQEMDQAGLAALTGSRAYTLSAPSQAATLMATTWRLANGPLPGPVHVTVPVDLLKTTCDCVPFRDSSVSEAVDVPSVSEEVLNQVRSLLESAERPALVLRPSLGRANHSSTLQTLQSGLLAFSADSARGLGDPALTDCREDLDNADLLIVLGPLDFAVGYGHPKADKPKPKVVLIGDADDELLDASARMGPDDLLVRGDQVAWLEALACVIDGGGRRPRSASQPPDWPYDDTAEPLHPLVISRAVGDQLCTDDVVVVDGGEFGQWIRADLHKCSNTSIYNGKLGAIGGSIPQAVGVAVAAPGRRVVVFIGDGSFGYYASELDTAAREGLNILVIVGNDSRWSAEWYQQEEEYGGPVATELEARNYDLVARGFGGNGKTIYTLAELQSELKAWNSNPSGVNCLNVISRSLPITDLLTY